MRRILALALFVAVAGHVAAQDGTTVNLEPEFTAASAAPGETAVYTLTIRNPTPTSQSYSLTALVSSPWNATIDPSSLTVGGSSNTTARLTVLVPANATIGTVRGVFVTARNAAITSDSDQVLANTTVVAPASNSVPSSSPNVPSSADPAETTSSETSAPFQDSNLQDGGEISNPRPATGIVRLLDIDFDRRAAAWAGAAGTTSLATGLLLLHESARLRLRAFFFLFSRLDRERVLDHGLRERIFESIRRAPGLHYGGLRRELGVAAGTLAHHLWVLERQNLVRSARDGFRKRYYPRGRADWGPPPLDEVQRRIVELVGVRPGIHQRAIAEQLRLSKQVVNYHVGQLAASGRLLVEREGRITHCYPARSGP